MELIMCMEVIGSQAMPKSGRAFLKGRKGVLWQSLRLWSMSRLCNPLCVFADGSLHGGEGLSAAPGTGNVERK